ncbi:ERCC4 domain-containing protein [Clostridium beijerinckii]|uniref:ERCC4 domain-containing protein n=1 Tax=Clostridium beijerinckii TaxID=1520 RepID=UPI00232D2BF9|nr:ERCC4 domain-containing protein [Clostridium beijerinckii]
MIKIRYKFTDKDIAKIQDSIGIIVDSREQNNKHILDYFNKEKIPYKIMKNDYADYSCYIPAGTIDMFTCDIYFDRDIAIERKASIDEIAGNLKGDATRLKTELAHLNMYDIKYWIFIEDPNYHVNLRTGNYRSQYDPKRLLKRIKTGIEAEYNTMIIPVSKNCIGSEIYYTLRGFVYTLFKHKGFILEESEELVNED